MTNEAWALICEISLLGWIFAAVGLILNAFSSRDTWRQGPAAVWGGCLLLFYAFWIVGMIKA